MHAIKYNFNLFSVIIAIYIYYVIYITLTLPLKIVNQRTILFDTILATIQSHLVTC